MRFGALAVDLGCYPLDREDYPSWSYSRRKQHRYSEFV